MSLVYNVRSGAHKALLQDLHGFKTGAGTPKTEKSETIMIRLENVEKVYQTEKIETLALNNINLEIQEGEFISVMGPSGCGKSTLLNIMGLLDVPTRGTVQLNGSPVVTRNDKLLAKIRNQQVGFIFQTFHLISDLSVLDNVEIPLLYRRLPGSKRRQLALKALERVGLSSRVHHFPSQLSGGQQQRVAIARAIVGQPRILLADEPTGNLDSQMGDEIMEILAGLNRDEKTTIVMVTHDPRLAGISGRILRLFDGRQVN
jgi:putative ABC transport system ATP-binding protein